MTTYAILDLDNCISADAWRRGMRAPHRANSFERFHTYHSLSAYDDFRNVWATLRAEHNIFLTGRPLWYRPLTEEWLRRNKVPYKYLFMRNNDDHRPSLELKSGMLTALWNEYDVSPASVAFAADDVPEIVAMYKEVGLPAVRVAIDNGH
jgi:hypothetical protein